MEINITWNICRVCLLEENKNQIQTSSGEQEHMRHIFNDDKQLVTQIYECSGVMMKPNDSLPEKICRKCFLMVKHAVNFRKTCRNSDVYLQSILQRTKSASSLFKPERHISFDLSDETSINEETKDDKRKNETFLNENDAINVKSEEGEDNLQIRKRNVSQFSQEDQTSKSPQLEIEIDIKSADDLITHEDEEEEMEGSDINHIVEIEEISDYTEHRIDDNSKHSHQQQKEVTELQDIDVHNNYSKLCSRDTIDSDVDEEMNEKNNFKHDSDELYYLLKGIKDENYTEAKENQQSIETEMHEESQEPEDNVEFVPEEEEDEQQLLHLESETDDSQAQVSSTVETKEDLLELQEQNSNISDETNELPTEYVVHEYFIDDSDSNLTSKKSNVMLANKKLPNLMIQTDKRRHVILPNRKTRSTTATSSTSTGNSGNVQKIYVCDICGNHFGNRQLMNAHIKVHRQEKNHECELCLKRFITACNLQAHMRIHTGEKPFECQYCGRRFNDRSSHLRHERIHTNEKPYQCSDCGKSFSLSTTLKKHMKIHTGERLYRCEPCAKSFKLSHQLKAHITTSLHKAVVQFAQLEN